MSSQKQNRKGVVGAQSGQYRATVERARDVVDPGSGCDNGALVVHQVPVRIFISFEQGEMWQAELPQCLRLLDLVCKW